MATVMQPAPSAQAFVNPDIPEPAGAGEGAGSAVMPEGEVSQLLVRWQEGDRSALDRVMPLVYSELLRLGRARLRRFPNQSLLQPTALVNEAWLKLVGRQDVNVRSRAHFFALAARVMRDLLVDHCRRQRAAKRGGSDIQIALDDANPADRPRQLDILVLDHAMRRLGEIKPRYTQIVELRFFAGLNIEETAAALDVSHSTIEREWNFARSWLRRELACSSGSR
jgi:RNA polymerase sigma factor (TIGR02999 family)